ncbi:hypothetical protein CEXT_632191, partial [Caerostris extrusa]
LSVTIPKSKFCNYHSRISKPVCHLQPSIWVQLHENPVQYRDNAPVHQRTNLSQPSNLNTYLSLFRNQSSATIIRESRNLFAISQPVWAQLPENPVQYTDNAPVHQRTNLSQP